MNKHANNDIEDHVINAIHELDKANDLAKEKLSTFSEEIQAIDMALNSAHWARGKVARIE